MSPNEKISKIAKKVEICAEVDAMFLVRKLSGSKEKASACAMACAAALRLSDSGARRAMIAILRDATPGLAVDEAMLAAIHFDCGEVLADVWEVFGADPSDVEWCAAATSAGKSKALAWLLAQGASASSSDGFAALCMVPKEPSGSCWGEPQNHAAAIDALCCMEELGKLGALSKQRACDGLATILQKRDHPSYGFSKQDALLANAAARGFEALWSQMTLAERVGARRGARLLFAAGSNFSGLFGAELAEGKQSFSPRPKTEEDKRVDEHQASAHWQACLPSWRKLCVLGAEQDWGAIEQACQAQKWSIVSATTFWLSSHFIFHLEMTMEQRAKCVEVFTRAEKVLGKRLAESSWVFDANGANAHREKFHDNWLLSEGVGRELASWVAIDQAGESYRAADEEVLGWLRGYAKQALSWCQGEKKPLQDGRGGRLGSSKSVSLEDTVMPRFERELMAWYRVAGSHEAQKIINKLANEWGGAKIDPEDIKSSMMAWHEKIEMTISSMSAAPDSKSEKKPTLRI